MFTTWLWWFVTGWFILCIVPVRGPGWGVIYCSGPVIRKHLSFRIMLPFRVALPSLYPPSFRRNDFFILYIYIVLFQKHTLKGSTRAQMFPDHRTRAITPNRSRKVKKSICYFSFSLKVYLFLLVEVDAVTAVGNGFSAAVLYCTRQSSAERDLFLASTAKTTTPLLKT